MGHIHPVEVYYEDTDFSGVVYHANYLKYFERAREHLIGRSELTRLYREDGIAFVVYHAELSYREGAVFGDTLEVETTVTLESPYRARFHQRVWRTGQRREDPGGPRSVPMVEGSVDLVTVNRAGKLVPLPAHVVRAIRV